MEKLTQRQQQVLDIVRQHIDQTGYPPTRADIARDLGFKSANAAEEHLKALARISRFLHDASFRGRLWKAGTREEVCRAVEEEDASSESRRTLSVSA